MAVCNFTIPFSGTAEDAVNKARSGIISQGGSFNGNMTSGTFSLRVLGSTIRGSYTISDQIKVIIDTKPFLISCNRIENFMKENLSG